MKYLLYVTTLTFLFFSCNDDDGRTNGIIGVWQLTEVLADPGNGSGVFSPINSDFNVLFENEGTYEGNGTFCFFDLDLSTAVQFTGSYDEERLVIIPDLCTNNQGEPLSIELPYELNVNELIIRPICIEGCALKFERFNFDE